MARGFTEQGTQERLMPYLQGGERLYAFASAQRLPHWGWYLIPLAFAAMTKFFAVGAKDTGLILVELDWTGKATACTIIPWNYIRDVSFKKGVFYHTLGFTTPDGLRWKLSFQYILQFRKNRQYGEHLASLVQQWSLAAQAQ